MVRQEIITILDEAGKHGWVMEPEAKRLFSLAGMDTPRFFWARKAEEAVDFAEKAGYPVVGKVVSPRVIHKTEVQGVALGLDSREKVEEAFLRFTRVEGFAGMLVEETLSGLELIVGGRVDFQFGPIVLLGMGGTGVEIYKDAALRMAPLEERDVRSMVQSLKARRLLEGYRGKEPVHMGELTRLLLTFSSLIMEIHPRIESIDLNPVFASATRVVVGDARIMLKDREGLPV
ncbi:MAG: acetate--CoA ligase family protein [Syntrophaceae bacterium]|nr:acetate--CoA ligase family protein [Syntrophaceae bacterium]